MHIMEYGIIFINNNAIICIYFRKSSIKKLNIFLFIILENINKKLMHKYSNILYIYCTLFKKFSKSCCKYNYFIIDKTLLI